MVVGYFEMKPVIPAKRQPKADKQQRRHLLDRIGWHYRKLAGEVSWDRFRDEFPDDPPEIAAARKIVADYDAEQEAKSDKLTDDIARLSQWLKEQVLFGSAEEALAVVKRYELLSVEQALSIGQTMEDRNDPPLLLNFSK